MPRAAHARSGSYAGKEPDNAPPKRRPVREPQSKTAARRSDATRGLPTQEPKSHGPDSAANGRQQMTPDAGANATPRTASRAEPGSTNGAGAHQMPARQQPARGSRNHDQRDRDDNSAKRHATPVEARWERQVQATDDATGTELNGSRRAGRGAAPGENTRRLPRRRQPRAKGQDDSSRPEGTRRNRPVEQAGATTTSASPVQQR